MCILGQATDVVEDYDYLGIHMEGQHRGFKQIINDRDIPSRSCGPYASEIVIPTE